MVPGSSSPSLVMSSGSQTIVLGPVTSAGHLVFDHRIFTIRYLLTGFEFYTPGNKPTLAYGWQSGLESYPYLAGNSNSKRRN